MEEQEIRAALERHWAASDANDFEREHQIYQEDAVLEYPQSGERIRGRQEIQASRTAQPNRKRFTVRRIIGTGDLWVTEYVLNYDGRPSYTVSIMEFLDGKVTRETQYFGDPFDPGPSRAQWVERMLYCWVAATAMASQLALPPPAAPRREPAEPIEPELKLSELLKLTPMAARPLPEADALLRTATTLILSVDRAMDRLLSLLPTAAWPPAQLGPEPGPEPEPEPELEPDPEPEPEPDWAEDIAIQQALDEVLEYHRTHRPPNTAKNYELKQREWKYKKISFKKGGKYLPGDYVDKGKLLLFIKDKVASCTLKQGHRLEAEKQ
ncbi:hypothetical protein B7463_g7504, partial [Scytalidium lignicola]